MTRYVSCTFCIDIVPRKQFVIQFRFFFFFEYNRQILVFRQHFCTMIHTSLFYTISDVQFSHYNIPIYTSLPRPHTDKYRFTIPAKRYVLVFILYYIGFTVSPLQHTNIYRFTMPTYRYIPFTHSRKTICTSFFYYTISDLPFSYLCKTIYTSFYTILYRFYHFPASNYRYISVYHAHIPIYTGLPRQHTDIYRLPVKKTDT